MESLESYVNLDIPQLSMGGFIVEGHGEGFGGLVRSTSVFGSAMIIG